MGLKTTPSTGLSTDSPGIRSCGLGILWYLRLTSPGGFFLWKKGSCQVEKRFSADFFGLAILKDRQEQTWPAARKKPGQGGYSGTYILLQRDGKE